MTPRLTLNGHALSDEQVLVLGFAFGAAQRRLERNEIADPALCTLLAQTLAELRAIARGQDPDAAAWPPQVEE